MSMLELMLWGVGGSIFVRSCGGGYGRFLGWFLGCIGVSRVLWIVGRVICGGMGVCKKLRKKLKSEKMNKWRKDNPQDEYDQ